LPIAWTALGLGDDDLLDVAEPELGERAVPFELRREALSLRAVIGL
jgi:hypothetical protein